MSGVVKILDQNEETIAAYNYNTISDRKNILRHWVREKIHFHFIQIYPHPHVNQVGINGENYGQSGR